MELHIVLSFIGTSILLSLMPGPDNIFVLTESLTKGQRNGIAISVGLSLGVLMHTLAAAAGLSIIIQQSATAFSVIKYAGAAYLFYLAYKAAKEKSSTIEFSVDVKKERAKISSLVRKGFFMNILNPKVSLFFIAFLPQFISYNGMNVTVQFIILGLLFMVQAFCVFNLIAILSGKLTRYIENARFWKITKWCSVTILTILGLTLAFSKR
jgi:threonine/homoserine/homoserine lactone efflux protein